MTQGRSEFHQLLIRFRRDLGLLHSMKSKGRGKSNPMDKFGEKVLERLHTVLTQEETIRNHGSYELEASWDSLGRDIIIERWRARERRALLTAVNELRAEVGKLPLYLDAIPGVEPQPRTLTAANSAAYILGCYRLVVERD